MMGKGKQMGITERGMLLMFLISHLCVVSSSSSPLHHETLPSSDVVQDKDIRGKSTRVQSSIGVDGSSTDEKAIIETKEFAPGIGRGSANGGSRSPNQGENGKSPNTPGGQNYIPVYAAGAANNRHPNHHGAGNCNRVRLSTILAATVTSLLHFYMVFACR